jgi:RimK family alpha-L-glutamate ligase
MKIGLLTRNRESWCSIRLINAIKDRKAEPVCLRFNDFSAKIGCKPEVTIEKDVDILEEFVAMIIRPIGRGSLEEILFRLDMLRTLKKKNLQIINSPSSIEKAVDKYRALSILEEKDIPVPKTIVTEDPKNALDAFYELGEDVIIKPIFGSRGVGITRVSDPEIAKRIFTSLAFNHNVIYVQEFIPHENRDIRAFVIGRKVIACMYRIADGWKTNVSQGARMVPLKPNEKIVNLAVNASQTIGCEVAGVDILESPEGYKVNEINSQPGFEGIQSTTKIDVAGAIIDYILSKFN